MSPDDRRRVLPTLFVVGGVLFAVHSLRGDLTGPGQVFGVVVGALVALYGGYRLREERRRPRQDRVDEPDGAPGDGPR